MKKKQLKIDEIKVNSFCTTTEDVNAKTVKGGANSVANDPSICDFRCISYIEALCTNAYVICL